MYNEIHDSLRIVLCFCGYFHCYYLHQVTHTKQVIRNWFAGTYTRMHYTGVQYSHAVTAVAVNTDYTCTM